MTKIKYVTCSPYKLLMGYEYSIKDDRQVINRQIKFSNENIRQIKSKSGK
jgi:hypothetical protein